MDAEDTDLRLCFRIISPVKTYTLQVIYLAGFGTFNYAAVLLRLLMPCLKKLGKTLI